MINNTMRVPLPVVFVLLFLTAIGVEHFSTPDLEPVAAATEVTTTTTELPDPTTTTTTTAPVPVTTVVVVESTAPQCHEDEASVVAPDPDPTHGLTWVCVVLDDFLDEEGFARLDAILANRGS